MNQRIKTAIGISFLLAFWLVPFWYPWAYPLQKFSQEFVLCASIALVALPLYFAPAIIAFRRSKRNRGPIALLNLVFGWTAFGWLAALAWACFDRAEQTCEILPRLS